MLIFMTSMFGPSPHLDKNSPTGLLHSPEKRTKCLKFKIFEIMDHKKLRERNNVASYFHQVRAACNKQMIIKD